MARRARSPHCSVFPPVGLLNGFGLNLIGWMSLLVMLSGCPSSGGGSGDSEGSGDGDVTTWIRNYGGEAADYLPSAVKEVSTGGFVVAGTVRKSRAAGDDRDVWVMRQDSAGGVMWSRSYGRTADAIGLDWLSGAARSADGGYAAIGRGADGLPTVAKVDGAGNPLWQTTIGQIGQVALVIRDRSGGGYVVAGADGDTVSGDDRGRNAWVVLLNSSGTVEGDWTIVTHDEDVRALDIRQTADGGYILVGEREPTGSYIAKLSPFGSVEHFNVYDPELINTPSRFNAVVQTADGGFVATGYRIDANIAGLNRDMDLVLVKYDAELSSEWDVIADSEDDEKGLSIAVDAAGGILVGSTRGGVWLAEGPIRPHLRRYYPTGSLHWQKSFEYGADRGGGAGIHSITATVPTFDGSFALGLTHHVVVVDSSGDEVWALDLADLGMGRSLQAEPIDGDDADSVLDDGFIVRDEARLSYIDDLGRLVWQTDSGAGGHTEDASAVVETADGGFLVAGSTSGAEGGSDIWLLRLDADGNLSWQRTRHGGYHETGRAVARTEDGFLVVGEIDQQAWLAKLNPEGGLIWEHTYGSLSGYSPSNLAILDTGGIAVAGTSGRRPWLARFNPDGTPDTSWNPWERIYDLPDSEEWGDPAVSSVGLEATADGGFVLLVDTQEEADGHVLKLDPAGDLEWSTSLYGDVWESGAAIAAWPFGGYVLALATAYGGGFPCAYATCPNIWVARLTSGGDVCWQHAYGTATRDVPAALALTTDGGIVVVGSSDGFSFPQYDAWTLKLDAEGLVSNACTAQLTPDPVFQAGRGGAARRVSYESATPDYGGGTILGITTIGPADADLVVARTCLGSGLPYSPDCDPPESRDDDRDGVANGVDNCPEIANPGQEDGDGDGFGDDCDGCPEDSEKTDPGTCGCGVQDEDADGNGTVDCQESCANVAGVWNLVVKEIDSSCGPEPDWSSTVDIQQTACSLETFGIKGTSFAVPGSVVGNTVTIGPGTFPEGSGATTATYTLTVDSPTRMTGQEIWVWTSPSKTCTGGTAALTAAR